MMTDEEERIATAVAAGYRKRCWWADFDDLRQEACVAVLGARQTFDPRVGVPFGGYAWRAASFAVQRYLWAQSAPVSGSQLRGLYRAPLDNGSVGEAVSPHAYCEEMEWREIVRREARDALEFLDAPVTDRVLAIIAGQMTSREVAARYSVPVAQVYAETALARMALASSAALWHLWRER